MSVMLSVNDWLMKWLQGADTFLRTRQEISRVI